MRAAWLCLQAAAVVYSCRLHGSSLLYLLWGIHKGQQYSTCYILIDTPPWSQLSVGTIFYWLILQWQVVCFYMFHMEYICYRPAIFHVTNNYLFTMSNSLFAVLFYQFSTCSLVFSPHWLTALCPLPISSQLMLTLQHSLQPNVPVSGMHVNCGNEGHLEEQLESSSASTTLPVGKFLPGVNLTRTPQNTIWSPPTTLHLMQGCCWDIQIHIHRALSNIWNIMRSAVQINIKLDRLGEN